MDRSANRPSAASASASLSSARAAAAAGATDLRHRRRPPCAGTADLDAARKGGSEIDTSRNRRRQRRRPIHGNGLAAGALHWKKCRSHRTAIRPFGGWWRWRWWRRKPSDVAARDRLAIAGDQRPVPDRSATRRPHSVDQRPPTPGRSTATSCPKTAPPCIVIAPRRSARRRAKARDACVPVCPVIARCRKGR